jgi:hypothetical protein
LSRWDLRLKPDGGHNTNIAGRNYFSWAMFDALPRELRQLIAYAPVKLGCKRAYDALMSGSPLAAVMRQEVLLARRFVGEHVLLSYGPTHPQAPGADSAA